MPRLIVNADDFGLCEDVNRGIEMAHRQGILTSASLLCNHPGWEQAREIAARNPGLGVGVHLNLVRGQPLLPEALARPLLNERGEFPGRIQPLRRRCGDPEFLRAAEAEYRAQIEAALAAGFSLDHLDSEKHHGIWRALDEIIARLAAEYQLGRRSYREPLWQVLQHCPWPGLRPVWWSLHLRTYAQLCLPPPAANQPDFFYGQSHIGQVGAEFLIALLENLPPGVSELMTHPSAGDCGQNTWLTPARRQAELAALCDAAVKKAADGVKLCTYASAGLF